MSSDAQAGGAQRAAGLGELDDGVGDLGDLGFGRAVRERDLGLHAVLLEEPARELGVLGVHAHAVGEVLDRLPRLIAADGEHDAGRAGGRLRVVQLGERHDVDAGLLDPVAAGDAEVEQAVGDVPRDLLRAQDRDVDDTRVVDRRRGSRRRMPARPRGRRLRTAARSPVRASPWGERVVSTVKQATGRRRRDSRDRTRASSGGGRTWRPTRPTASSARRRSMPRASTSASHLREARHAFLHVGVEVRLGAVPVAAAEPVDAVGRHRHGFDTKRRRGAARCRRRRARCVRSRGRGSPGSSRRRSRRRSANSARRRTAPAGARRAASRRGPRRDRVQWCIVSTASAASNAPVAERQCLGDALHRGCGAGRALREHRRATARPRRRDDPRARTSRCRRRRSRTVRASPSAAWMGAAMRGSVRRVRA